MKFKQTKKLLNASLVSLALTGFGSDLNASEEIVLNVSPRDYVESVGRKLSDYEMKGVHSIGQVIGNCPKNLGSKTISRYPNVEVIVNFDSNRDHWKICYGTALIPKKK